MTCSLSDGTARLSPGDQAYPGLLRQISDPPDPLYRRGPYQFDLPQVAVVGSRRATFYGLRIARELGGELARRGFCTVSGLARGIDTAAHEGALAAGGRTVAVLGSGLDVVYPPENADLHRRIGETGALLSEWPPNRPPEQWTFPQRNRIVSGLCWAVVVVESAADGGAMITARLAGEQGRSVLAVPGRIDQTMSEGCHRLIRDGAILFTGIDDLLEELNYLPGLRAAAAAAPRQPRPARADLGADEDRLWACLGSGAVVGPDALAARTGLSPAAVSAGLLSLELKGLAARHLDGRYEAL